MTDDRPSISELQDLEAPPRWDEDHDCQVACALPALLAIARAALALQEQEQVAAKARFLVYSRLNAKAVPSDENYAAADMQDRKLKQCRDAYLAALAKVRP